MDTLDSNSKISQASFFVSPTGSDAFAGTIEQPFATIERARAAVYELKKTKENGRIIVLVRGGTY